MKITKLVHSCLLVESNGKRALIDPGNYSWKSGYIDNNILSDIDYVVITHIHVDHYDPEFCSAIYEQSPDALWYAPHEVVIKLNEQGIQKGYSQSNVRDVIFVASEHADGKPWFTMLPQHTSFKLFDNVFISGDNQTITDLHGAKILAGALTAPWGSIVACAKMLYDMKPKPEVFIPVHDWHLNDQARESAYQRAAEVLNEFNINVMVHNHGVSFEL